MPPQPSGRGGCECVCGAGPAQSLISRTLQHLLLPFPLFFFPVKPRSTGRALPPPALKRTALSSQIPVSAARSPIAFSAVFVTETSKRSILWEKEEKMKQKQWQAEVAVSPFLEKSSARMCAQHLNTVPHSSSSSGSVHNTMLSWTA